MSETASSEWQEPTRTTSSGKEADDEILQQSRVNSKTRMFEEKIYRAVGNGTSENPQSKTSSETIASTDMETKANHSNDSSESTLLPLAVRSCWPDLYPTMSSAKKRIRKGIFFVKRQGNNTDDLPIKGRCDTRVEFGDVILRQLPTSEEPRHRTHGPSTENILSRAVGGKLRIAYLDRDLAVVVKPHGMPVNKIRKDQIDTNDDTFSTEKTQDCSDSSPPKDNSGPVSMHELLLHCLPTCDGDDCLRRPAAVHRLDQPTYGLMVVARTRSSARCLAQAFEERPETLVKRYRALVHGHIPGEIHKGGAPCKGAGTLIQKPLGGKTCTSEYFITEKLVIETDACNTQQHEKQQAMNFTLVDLILHTGRKHQLRKHLAFLGHPIVGDSQYGNDNADKDIFKLVAPTKNDLPLLLAAVEITFPHPRLAIVNDSESLDSGNSAKNLDHAVVAEDSKYHLDVSRRTLNVAIDMPESMTKILQIHHRKETTKIDDIQQPMNDVEMNVIPDVSDTVSVIASTKIPSRMDIVFDFNGSLGFVVGSTGFILSMYFENWLPYFRYGCLVWIWGCIFYFIPLLLKLKNGCSWGIGDFGESLCLSLYIIGCILGGFYDEETVEKFLPAINHTFVYGSFSLVLEPAYQVFLFLKREGSLRSRMGASKLCGSPNTNGEARLKLNWDRCLELFAIAFFCAAGVFGGFPPHPSLALPGVYFWEVGSLFCMARSCLMVYNRREGEGLKTQTVRTSKT